MTTPQLPAADSLRHAATCAADGYYPVGGAFSHSRLTGFPRRTASGMSSATKAPSAYPAPNGAEGAA